MKNKKTKKRKQPLIITYEGKPVITVIPFQQDSDVTRKSLRGTIISYDDPLEPVGEKDWEALK